jgi:glycerol kinase
MPSTVPYILAIDQGTTSTRAIVFDAAGRSMASAQQEFTQIYPRDGWVEHDAEEIWSKTLEVSRQALVESERQGGQVVGIGITNQRETTVVWDRRSGAPVGNAIVWQDRRTTARCETMREDGHEAAITEKTGLLIDPYFSATKLAWILENVEGAAERACSGDLAFGTIDSFLIWRLSGGSVHATDATNAARTMLFDIHAQRWDPELLALLGVPDAMLPEVRDCTADYGQSVSQWFGRPIPVCGVAGDQQAAAVGQACFEPGMIKSTYGTGCFVLQNTGERALRSQNRLLTTVAYRLEGRITYALEGSIFIAGAAVQWLRDKLRIVDSAPTTEGMAAELESNRGVYMVPAFTGLGAPHWDPHVRGALFGINRDTGREEIVRATLESVCYQTRDLLVAMERDGAGEPATLRVDGGMVANGWLAQFLADLLNVPVQRPVVTETTALGAARLAGLQAGVYDSLEEIARQWRCEATFNPSLDAGQRDNLVKGWDVAVECARRFAEFRQG